MLVTSAASWTKVFHSAQSGHCPCQRIVTDPQAWHTYRVFAFATHGTIHERRRQSSDQLPQFQAASNAAA
jgi:hypothetical protein